MMRKTLTKISPCASALHIAEVALEEYLAVAKEAVVWAENEAASEAAAAAAVMDTEAVSRSSTQKTSSCALHMSSTG